MENFVGAAALAVLTGLTWLAYKHPSGYSVISIPLLSVNAAAFGLGVAYNLGVQAGSHAVLMSVIRAGGGRLEGIDHAAVPATIDQALLFGGLPLLFAYLLFLRALPSLLGLRKEREIEDKGKPRD